MYISSIYYYGLEIHCFIPPPIQDSFFVSLFSPNPKQPQGVYRPRASPSKKHTIPPPPHKICFNVLLSSGAGGPGTSSPQLKTSFFWAGAPGGTPPLTKGHLGGGRRRRTFSYFLPPLFLTKETRPAGGAGATHPKGHHPQHQHSLFFILAPGRRRGTKHYPHPYMGG